MGKELISSYTRCPVCGSDAYLAEPPGQRSCRECGHRDFNNPIVAVAAVILDAKDHVLLIQRAKDPAKGKLAMPGGFVDRGESLEDAVHREIAEEIGLSLKSVTYLCSHPNSYCYQSLDRPVCDVIFLAEAETFDVVLQQEEVKAWSLIRLVDINPQDLAFDSMRHALAVLLGQRARRS
jgi:ADP-ribose pyrophosphatase YjhB (NUDIX family)